MSASPKLVSENRCFGGTVSFYSHRSETCNGEMRFSVYQPPQAKSNPVPVLYFLAGLTCTEENFMTKAGAQQFAAKPLRREILVCDCPNGTSLRLLTMPELTSFAKATLPQVIGALPKAIRICS